MNGKVLVFSLMLACAACAGPSDVASRRVVAEPVATPTPDPTPEPTPTPAPTPRPTARPVAAPTPTPVSETSLAAFRDLGGWIDVFDTTDGQAATVLPFVRDMARQGVRTLYLETARFDDATPFRYPAVVAAALEEAHRLGMKVVAWYPPDFVDVDRDVSHSLAAVRYRSPGGHRFDAFAADIEYTQGVPDAPTRNARAVEYSKRLRAGSGAAYPLAAIVIPPTSHEINPSRWPSFPWSQIAPSYDVFMPMNYWTGRTTDPRDVRDLTSRNTTETRRLSERPVHVIGGVADRVDEAQARAYVEAALAAGSIGGGLYDYRTTDPSLYPVLRTLNR